MPDKKTDIEDLFKQYSGKKTSSQKLHKKFDKKVDAAKGSHLVDKKQGYKKLPQLNKNKSADHIKKLLSGLKAQKKK
jgi:hypothetical protein